MSSIRAYAWDEATGKVWPTEPKVSIVVQDLVFYAPLSTDGEDPSSVSIKATSSPTIEDINPPPSTAANANGEPESETDETHEPSSVETDIDNQEKAEADVKEAPTLDET